MVRLKMFANAVAGDSKKRLGGRHEVRVVKRFPENVNRNVEVIARGGFNELHLDVVNQFISLGVDIHARLEDVKLAATGDERFVRIEGALGRKSGRGR